MDEIKTSHLYHIQPIGIGTPNVESLPSYIKRLAEAHHVSTGNLLIKEIIPHINKSYLRKEHFVGDSAKSKKLNVIHSKLLDDVISVLEKRIHNDNLAYLTMSSWKEFFNPTEMFRKMQAWCPMCYEESKRFKLPVYEQLIWSFKNIKFCKKHKIRLVEICPHCGNTFGYINSLSRVGYCDKCHAWLGNDNFEDDAVDNLISSDWYSWVYDNLGELLAITPSMENRNCLKFSHNIINLIKLQNTSMRKFGKDINATHNKIHNWILGRKPSLEDAMIISYKYRYPLTNILIEDINSINDIYRIDIYNNNIIMSDKRKKGDISEVKKAINEAIESNTVLSMQKLNDDFKIKPDTIKKYLPEEVIRLQDNNKKCLQERKLSRLKLIKDTTTLLFKSGIFPSGKALKRHLGKRVLINDYEKEVWLKTLEELGCTNEYYNDK